MGFGFCVCIRAMMPNAAAQARRAEPVRYGVRLPSRRCLRLPSSAAWLSSQNLLDGGISRFGNTVFGFRPSNHPVP